MAIRGAPLDPAAGEWTELMVLCLDLREMRMGRMQESLHVVRALCEVGLVEVRRFGTNYRFCSRVELRHDGVWT